MPLGPTATRVGTLATVDRLEGETPETPGPHHRDRFVRRLRGRPHRGRARARSRKKSAKEEFACAQHETPADPAALGRRREDTFQGGTHQRATAAVVGHAADAAHHGGAASASHATPHRPLWQTDVSREIEVAAGGALRQLKWVSL